jgi:hypothetical protein
MGVIMTTCCQNDRMKSELNTSSTMFDNISYDEQILNETHSVKDSAEGLNYIISNECYELLIRKIPKVILTKRISKNLKTSEIFNFIKKCINYISTFKMMKGNVKIKKYILMAKNYTKFGTKNILDDLNDINYSIKNNDDNYLLQSLSDWIMLIQLIIFLNNKNDNKNRGSDFSCKNTSTAYDINLWYNKNFEKVIKKYCFDGCFFLIQIKIKYISHNNKYNTNQFLSTPSDLKVSNEIKNQSKKLLCLTEDFVKEISNDDDN